MNINMIPIGEVAKKFNIESTRLRDWCKRGFVEAEFKSNVRYISKSEFEKIQAIISFFEQGSKRTFEDLREHLQKENLFSEHKNLQEVKKLENTMAAVLEKQQIGQAFQLVAEKFREQTNQMHQIFEVNEQLTEEIVELKALMHTLLEMKNGDSETKQLLDQLVQKLNQNEVETTMEKKSMEIEKRERELQTQELQQLLKSIQYQTANQGSGIKTEDMQKIMDELSSIRDEASVTKEELNRIKQRGFWARLFNK